MRLTSEKQIPARIQACAHRNSLGVPRIVYEPYKESRLYLFLGPFAILVSMIIFGVYYFNYASVFSWWPLWQHAVVLAIGLAWLLIGLWMLFTPLLAPHIRVYLCPGGLIYVRRTLEAIRWDQIVLLYKELLPAHQSARQNTSLRNYTLLREDGRHFVLNNDLPYLDRLGRFMEREIARYLLPGAIATYEANLPQSFGALLIDQQGVTLRREGTADSQLDIKAATRHLPWPNLLRISLDDTTLSLYQTGSTWAWATLSVSGLPNLWVLKGLIEHVVGQSATSSRADDAGSAAAIVAPATAAVEPLQFSAYDAGFSLFFGSLSVSKEGVTLNNSEEYIPWKEIESFGIGESEVIVKRVGSGDRWYTVPLWTVTDLAQLRQLIDYAFYQQYSS